MDEEFFKELQRAYDSEAYDRRDIDNVVTEIDQDKNTVDARIKDFQDKTEKANQQIVINETQLKEIENLRCEQVSLINELDSKLNEKLFELKNLNELTKSYLLRREKAKAKLSKTDTLFMASIQNRYKAYKFLTGIHWDYPRCDVHHVEGFIINSENHRTKFFRGQPDPDELWRKIEKLTSEEDD